MKYEYQKELVLIRDLAFIFMVITIFMPEIMAQDYTADVWLQKGDEFYKNNSYDLALRCYDKAIEINPLDAKAWNNKGNTLKEMGRLRKQMPLLQKR